MAPNPEEEDLLHSELEDAVDRGFIHRIVRRLDRFYEGKKEGFSAWVEKKGDKNWFFFKWRRKF